MDSPYPANANYDGTWGLRQQGTSNGDFLGRLYAQGQIDSKMVCIYMPKNESYFSVQVGNYNETLINGTSRDITWYPSVLSNNNQGWALNMQSFGYGSYTFNTTGTYTFVSGNSKVGVTSSLWSNLLP